MSSRLRIIVTGLIAQHPSLGGVTWDYLQYAVGLARLGHDVYYFEDSGQWPYPPDGGATGNEKVAYDPTSNVARLAEVMARFGLADRWAYRFPIKPAWFGLSSQRRRSIVQSADLLLNVSGTLARPLDYREIPRLVYIDSDPVFTQVKLNLSRGHLKFRKQVDAHDVHFSFGESFSECVPKTGHRWRGTRQPVILPEWRPSTKRRETYTTVMNWTSYPPLSYSGRTYGQKDLEFKRFLELPERIPSVPLEVALGKIEHEAWEREDDELSPSVRERIGRHPHRTPRDLLVNHGWQVVDAHQACCDLDTYRDYIESSKAEWSIAKNGYVTGQAGWFSCRSACYLASGRPVVVQETGFSRVLPVGEGILPFSSLDEAVTAIERVEANFDRHSKAAREIAEEYFDSDKVLTRLLDEAMNYSVGSDVSETHE